MQDLHTKIKEIFAYDPNVGVFIKKSTGKEAGWKNQRGYVCIQIDKKAYRAHRLAWCWVYGVYPENEIDHIDGNPSNNKIANLRLATRSVNAQNRMSSVGVTVEEKYKKKYKVRIRLNGKQKHLGYFYTFEEARNVYLTAKKTFHEGCSHWEAGK